MADDFGMGYALGQDNGGGNSGNGGMFGGSDGWLGLIVILALFGGFGRGGFGGMGGNDGGGGALTRNDLCEGFNFNNLQRGVSGIQQGICDSTYALNNSLMSGFANTNTAMMQGFSGVDKSLCTLGYNLQNCCCETQRLIERSNYDAATNTCNIIQSTHNDTDRIIAKLSDMEAARQAEKIEALRLENQSLKFGASQSAQNGYIDAVVNAAVQRIAPQPVPSFGVPAPYPFCGPINQNCGCNSCC